MLAIPTLMSLPGLIRYALAFMWYTSPSRINPVIQVKYASYLNQCRLVGSRGVSVVLGDPVIGAAVDRPHLADRPLHLLPEGGPELFSQLK